MPLLSLSMAGGCRRSSPGADRGGDLLGLGGLRLLRRVGVQCLPGAEAQPRDRHLPPGLKAATAPSASTRSSRRRPRPPLEQATPPLRRRHPRATTSSRATRRRARSPATIVLPQRVAEDALLAAVGVCAPPTWRRRGQAQVRVTPPSAPRSNGGRRRATAEGDVAALEVPRPPTRSQPRPMAPGCPLQRPLGMAGGGHGKPSPRIDVSCWHSASRRGIEILKQPAHGDRAPATRIECHPYRAAQKRTRHLRRRSPPASSKPAHSCWQSAFAPCRERRSRDLICRSSVLPLTRRVDVLKAHRQARGHARRRAEAGSASRRPRFAALRERERRRRLVLGAAQARRGAGGRSPRPLGVFRDAPICGHSTRAGQPVDGCVDLYAALARSAHWCGDVVLRPHAASVFCERRSRMDEAHSRGRRTGEPARAARRRRTSTSAAMSRVAAARSRQGNDSVRRVRRQTARA